MLLLLIEICFVKFILPIVVEVMGLIMPEGNKYSIAIVTNFDKYGDCVIL